MGSIKTPEELVELFPGSFIHWFQREHPSHTVKITQPYFLGAHEVTVGNFEQFILATGYQTSAETIGNSRTFKDGKWLYQDGANWRESGLVQDETHPVSCVSWDDAMAFCQWLSKQEGREYGLPTEAQWEYACRAGTVTEYFWGDDPDLGDGYLNAGDITGISETRAFRFGPTTSLTDPALGTAPVGSFKPNAFGLYDMAGNLWEWCSDWSSDYQPQDQQDPVGPETARRRASRGAGWPSESWNWRSSFRSRSTPTYRCADLGFRVVLTASVNPTEVNK
jgi:formylglycine-generating enzyme required for sulfatase activity